MITTHLKSFIGVIRLPFLLLTPVCILLGFETARLTSAPINGNHFALVMIGALLAHISVNTLNEYFDFTSGLDLETRRTSFSGGSGTLPAQPAFASATLAIAVLSLLGTALIGLYFISVLGPAIFPIGVAGLLLVAFYTTALTRHPILCLVAPGLGFGPLMVVGTHLVLTGGYTDTAWAVSLVPFFLVNNLLLLNQYPDVEADLAAGRRTLPIAVGRAGANVVFTAFLLSAYASLFMAVDGGGLPRGGLLGLASVVVAVPTLVGAWRYRDDMKRLMPYLGLNVMTVLSTPLLIVIGLRFL